MLDAGSEAAVYRVAGWSSSYLELRAAGRGVAPDPYTASPIMSRVVRSEDGLPIV